MDKEVVKTRILKDASYEIGAYFANKITEERIHGKVAILVQDQLYSLYFIACDEYGFPKYRDIQVISRLLLNDILAISKNSNPIEITREVETIHIDIQRPLMLNSTSWDIRPYVYMWEGRITGKEKIPLKDLEVSELLKIAQETIKNREGLVIDEAIKNKIYK